MALLSDMFYGVSRMHHGEGLLVRLPMLRIYFLCSVFFACTWTFKLLSFFACYFLQGAVNIPQVFVKRLNG